METTLAILMALGIYLGVPVVIGLMITGGYAVIHRNEWKTAKTTGKATEAFAKTA